jgi:hypothetical protein
MTEKEMLTSTGSLGLERRTHNRMYLNWRFGVLERTLTLERQVERANQLLEGQEDITRCVGRFLVSGSVYGEIIDNRELSGALEGSAPVVDWSGQRLAQMVMFGLNSDGRNPLTSSQTMITETSLRPSPSRMPLARVRAFEKEGIQFTNQIQDWMIPQIYALWGETFGWDAGGVENLRDRLMASQHIAPTKRPVWFSAAVARRTLFSISMAERLDLPLGDGRSVPIIESTEWRTLPGNERRGLMAATVSYLHEQVISDLQQNPLPPLIVAETNYRSSAYRVGWAAGMEVPERHGGAVPSQILVQNVEVVDGHAPQGLRDFILMHLPMPALTQNYAHVLYGNQGGAA